jgi:hypothetical protein
MDRRPLSRWLSALPLLLVVPAGSGCSGELQLGAGEDPRLDFKPASADCTKQVFVHISNFSWFEEPANSGIPLNGCWGYNMLNRYQHAWAQLKDLTPAMVDGGSDSNAGGAQRWAYNETSFSHEDPTDAEKIDQGRDEYQQRWGVPASTEGYEYMMYRGPSGWKKSGNPNVAKSFAEVYGGGEWFPDFDQWKAAPVGRPMGNIPDPSDGDQTYAMVKSLCDYVEGSTFIGINAGWPVPAGSPALDNLVYALNDCTR